MLINTDSEEFKDMCKLRRSQKAYEHIGDFKSSRMAFNLLKMNIEKASLDVLDLIDEANKEQG